MYCSENNGLLCSFNLLTNAHNRLLFLFSSVLNNKIQEDIVVPTGAEERTFEIQVLTDWAFKNPVLAILLGVGVGGLARMAWNTAAPSTFIELGPALFISGAIAIFATLLAYFMRGGGGRGFPFLPLQISASDVSPLGSTSSTAVDAVDAVAGGGGGDGGGGGGGVDLPGPSEPVSPDSIEDLVRHPEPLNPTEEGGGGGGLLDRIEHGVEGAMSTIKEEVMEFLDPGQEMAGDVTIQETTDDPGGGGGRESGGVEKGAVVFAEEKEKEREKRDEKKEKSEVSAGGYSSDSDVPGPGD